MATQILALTAFISTLSTEAAALQVKTQDEPFNTFRSLDAQLSALEAQFRDFKSDAEKAGKIRNAKRRAAAYKKLCRSKPATQIRGTVSSIGATVRGLGSRRRMRKSRYGRVISHALLGKATAMKRSLDRVMAARDRRQMNRSLKEFSNASLAFVFQFQAVSGGYGALQCEPGEWTCCVPKKAPAKGAAALHGCSWVCVKKARSCRRGCLGPRTPSPVHQRKAIQQRRLTAVPKPRSP